MKNPCPNCCASATNPCYVRSLLQVGNFACSSPGYVSDCDIPLLRLFFFVFGLFFIFTRTRVVSLLNHHARLGKYVRIHTYKQCTYHYDCCTYYLPVDSIGHKTGTRREQVKNTRLPPQNYSGALAP